MVDFFREELVYILISLFILGIVVFVTTRPFVAKKARIAIPIAAVLLGGLLLLHYNWRMHHIKEVAKAFYEGKNILCLDKTNKFGSVLIHKGEWKFEHGEFSHPEFPRTYNIRQCVVE